MNKQARNPGTVQKRMANYDRKEGRTARSTGPIFKQICFTMMYKKDPQKSDLKKKNAKQFLENGCKCLEIDQDEILITFLQPRRNSIQNGNV